LALLQRLASIMFSDCALADKAASASGSRLLGAWRPRRAARLGASNIYYHTSVSAGTTSRCAQFALNRVPANVTLNANLNLNINAIANLGFVIPSIFATPVLGGQASVSLMAAMASSAPASQGLCPAWPRAGRHQSFGPLSDNISDTTWGFTDLAPMFQ
jgi:hypothetical protein